jgi:hypothetical protein
LRPNADPEGNRSTELAEAYSQGQSDIIDALEAMRTRSRRTLESSKDWDKTAVREMEWLVPELNRIRKKGVGRRTFGALLAEAKARQMAIAA